MNNRLNELNARLKNLKSLMAKEKKGDNSPTYISDLQESIAGCERELLFLENNPSGVEMVNGV